MTYKVLSGTLNICSLTHSLHQKQNKSAKLRHVIITAAAASPCFSLCQSGQWSFRALLLILTLCFCSNCGI